MILAVNQEYETNAEQEYAIIGNSALLKCKIPSFVADFVAVESWKDNKDNEYFSGMSSNYGILTLFNNLRNSGHTSNRNDPFISRNKLNL